MAAAVADFRPKAVADEKLKKGDGVPEIVLEPTADILSELGARKRAGQIVVGFAAETERLQEHAAAKLAAKRVDLMVANDVSADDSGFEVDTNRALVLDAAGGVVALPLLTKDALADWLVDRIARALGPSPDHCA
jgi:phosphopantothenoylcysteine decarboxylase/phosphopantothenate--cysteine ligase